MGCRPWHRGSQVSMTEGCANGGSTTELTYRSSPLPLTEPRYAWPSSTSLSLASASTLPSPREKWTRLC